MTQVNDTNKRTIERIYANARPNQYRQTTTRMDSKTGNKQRQRKDHADKAAEARKRPGKGETNANRNRANHKGVPSKTTSKNYMLRRHEHTTKNTSQEREDYRKAEEKMNFEMKTKPLVKHLIINLMQVRVGNCGAHRIWVFPTTNLPSNVKKHFPV